MKSGVISLNYCYYLNCWVKGGHLGSSEKGGARSLSHTRGASSYWAITKALPNRAPTCLSSRIPCSSSACFLATPPLMRWFLISEFEAPLLGTYCPPSPTPPACGTFSGELPNFLLHPVPASLSWTELVTPSLHNFHTHTVC